MKLRKMISGVIALTMCASMAVMPVKAANDGAVTNFMAVGRDRYITATWKCANRDDVTDIKVYREDGSLLASVDGGDFSTIHTTSRKVTRNGDGYVVYIDGDGNEQSLSGIGIFSEYVNDASGTRITNGNHYVVDLEVSYADGTVYRTSAVSNILNDRGAMKWGSVLGTQDIINYGWEEAISGYPLIKFEVVKDVKYEGNASLLIKNNLTEAKNNTFAQLGPKLSSAMEYYTTYEFSYYTKGVNAGWYAVGYGGRWGSPRHEETLGTTDWVRRSFTVTTTDDISDIRFQFERPTEAMYIDNVSIFKLDEEGNPVGDNLVANGGFESCDLTAPDAVTDASVYLDDNSNAVLSWSKSNDTAYTKIYSGDNLLDISTGTSATIPNQAIGAEYTLKACDDSGNESIGATAEIKAPEVKPANLMAVGRDRYIMVSWKNPNRTDITDIKVYRADGSVVASVDEGKIYTADNSDYTLSKNDEGYVIYTDDSGVEHNVAELGVYIDFSTNADGSTISNGTRHMATVELTYADGTSYKEATISNILNDRGGMIWSGILGTQEITDYGWEEAVNARPCIDFALSKDVKYEGNAALLVRSNLNGAISNVFTQLGPKLSTAMESEKTYNFSYYIKGINAGWYAVGYGGRWGSPRFEETLGTTDWVKRDFDITTTDDISDIRFQFERSYEALYIDNVVLVEVDEEGNPIGENLLVNGDFEACDITAPADVTDVKAVIGDDGKTVISWTKPADDYAFANIYSDYSGELNLIAATAGSSITLTGEKAGTEYIVKACDALENEANGVAVVSAGVNIAPVNFMAVGRDKALSVSWRNPERNDITSIELYNAAGEIVGSTANNNFVTDASACNYIDIGDVANGTRHIYQIKITYANGESYVGECASNVLNDKGVMNYGAPGGAQDVSGWNEGVAGMPHIKYDVTTETAHSGEASLMIRSNIGSAIANTFQKLGPNYSALEEGKTYKFSYWIKAKNAKFYAVGCGGRWGSPKIESIPGSVDWNQQSFTFTAPAGGAIYFELDNSYEAIYLDDVELVEIDADGNAVSANLLENGTFEQAETADVYGAKAEARRGVATVSWSVPEGSDVAYVMVCEEYKGNVNTVKVAMPSVNSVSFKSDADSYTIKTVNTYGAVSEGVTVAVEKAAEPIIYDEIVIVDGSGEVAEYVDIGDFTASVNVTNQSMGDEFKPVLAAAVYMNNETLVDVDVLNNTVITQGETEELTATVTVPVDYENSFTIKVFLWEGDNMIPVASAILE